MLFFAGPQYGGTVNKSACSSLPSYPICAAPKQVCVCMYVCIWYELCVSKYFMYCVWVICMYSVCMSNTVYQVCMYCVLLFVGRPASALWVVLRRWIPQRQPIHRPGKAVPVYMYVYMISVLMYCMYVCANRRCRRSVPWLVPSSSTR